MQVLQPACCTIHPKKLPIGSFLVALYTKKAKATSVSSSVFYNTCMRVRFTLISALLLFFTVAPVPARAQGTPKDVYYKATVESVAEEGSKTVSGMTLPYQIVTVRILDGNLSKRLLTIEHGTIF